ncbi:MAG: J domain-containing protein [Erythrobacter sp.]
MLRLAIILLIVCLVFRWALGKWPWDFAKGPPTRSQALFKARKLLGVGGQANHEEITAAHKRLMAMVHPDKGGTSEQVHEANAARDLLFDELPDLPPRSTGEGDDPQQ